MNFKSVTLCIFLHLVGDVQSPTTPTSDYSAEADKILGIYGIETPTPNEKILAKQLVLAEKKADEQITKERKIADKKIANERKIADEKIANEQKIAEYERNRATEAEKNQNSFRNVAASMFFKSLLEKFKNEYLFYCIKGSRPLNDVQRIKLAIRNFLNGNCSKRAPKKIKEMAKDVNNKLQEINITKDTFIKMEVNAYGNLTKFIYYYEDHCINNLTTYTCDILIKRVPLVEKELKDVVAIINEKMNEK